MFMHGRSRHFSLDGTARLFVYSTCRVLPGSTRITGGTLLPAYLNSDLPVSGSDAAASATGVVASGGSGRVRSSPDGVAAIKDKIANGPDRTIPSLRTIPIGFSTSTDREWNSQKVARSVSTRDFGLAHRTAARTIPSRGRDECAAFLSTEVRPCSGPAFRCQLADSRGVGFERKDSASAGFTCSTQNGTQSRCSPCRCCCLRTKT